MRSRRPFRSLLSALTAFALPVGSLVAQTPSLSSPADGTWRLDWVAQPGRTYFVQWSEDLEHWSYYPAILSGPGNLFFQDTPTDTQGAPLPRFFFRLASSDKPIEISKEADDFDGDGVSNWDELTITHTNPFDWDTNGDGKSDWFTDSDGDGLADMWELRYFQDLDSAAPGGDADQDGLTNAEESTLNTDPDGHKDTTDSDGDGIADAQDAVPGDALVNWHETFATFAWLPLDPPQNAGEPLQVNDKGEVLFSGAVWSEGTWTTVNSGDGQTARDCTPVVFNDTGTIVGHGEFLQDGDWVSRIAWWTDAASPPQPLETTAHTADFGYYYTYGVAGNYVQRSAALNNADQLVANFSDIPPGTGSGTAVWTLAAPLAEPLPAVGGTFGIDDQGRTWHKGWQGWDTFTDISGIGSVPDGSTLLCTHPGSRFALTGTVGSVRLQDQNGAWERSSFLPRAWILSENGTAVTNTESYYPPPFIRDDEFWQNGEYTKIADLDALKDSSGAPLFQTAAAIDMARKSGIILVRGTAADESQTTGLLVPVEIIIPNLDSEGNQIDGEFVNASELKVAKWEDAFDGGIGGGSVKDDFIGWDKDRFHIHIPAGADLGIEAVKVATEGCPDGAYNDDPTRIDLAANGSDAISDSMILVSDDHDDDFAESGAGVDDQPGDRTHKVQLGGDFVIKSFIINGSEYDVNMRVPVPVRKIIQVDFIRMAVPGVHSLVDIDDSVKVVNERYAQVGLRVDATIKELPWPNLPGRDPGYLDLFDEPDGELVGPLTDEYKQFIDQTDSQGTNLFFFLSAYSSRGIAITPHQLIFEVGDLDGKYLDKAFLNSALAPQLGYTPSHELLHLLAYRTDGSDDHDESFWNLLSVGPGSDLPVMWRKRINGTQQNLIDQHPQVKDPQ